MGIVYFYLFFYIHIFFRFHDLVGKKRSPTKSKIAMTTKQVLIKKLNLIFKYTEEQTATHACPPYDNTFVACCRSVIRVQLAQISISGK